MSVLLDTNVLSEMLRAQPHPGVAAWMAAQPVSSLYVSAVSQAEMLLGAQVLPAGKRRQQLQQALHAIFYEDFAGRVLPFDSAAASDYAVVATARRRAGAPISQFDAQIAAIAVTHRLSVVTRNVPDFKGCGVTVINPWNAN